jgi:predicted peptidase
MRIKAVICLSGLAALLAVGRARAASVSDFADFTLRSGATTVLPGRLYIPPEANLPGASRPLILFLHGGGEAGANNLAQINGNIDFLLAEAKRRGAYLYAPQSPSTWSSATLSANVMTMIERALVEQHVDADRLYVTGLSNGGGGTWNMLSRYPTSFAAGIPICGVIPWSDFTPANLVDQAIAAFHARDDSVVSFQTSRNVINQILTTAGEDLPAYPDRRSTGDFVYISPELDLAYVEFGRGGHGIWPGVYNSPELYDWLFAHTLAVPEPSSLATAGLAFLMIAARRRATRRFAHDGSSA